MTMNYEIARAAIDDAADILHVQKAAYRIEARRYHTDDIAPLRQTLAELQKQFDDHVILKAVSADGIIGTVRAFEKEGTCYVGRLAVLPERHHQGIGAALMRAIEKFFRPQRFELFTGSQSDGNIRLYQQLGYSVCKRSSYGHGTIEIVYMEKMGTAEA
jgi:GNAT superfamily N-acetyltransferase